MKRGLKVGINVHIGSNVVLDADFPYLITLGDECTIGRGTIILAHDASTKRYLNYTKVGKVHIGNRTFVGANVVILPNVRIGSNVIVGAGSVVSQSVPDGVVVAGNPAKIIGTTEDYIRSHRKQLQDRLLDRGRINEVIKAIEKYGVIYMR